MRSWRAIADKQGSRGAVDRRCRQRQGDKTIVRRRCRAAPTRSRISCARRVSKRGDHLLLLLGNVVPLWETMLAAIKLGVVVIPATTLLTPDELRDRLDRGRAKAVVASQDQVAKFASLGADGSCASWSALRRSMKAGCRSSRSATFPENFAPDGPTNADDPMLLYFTSGTTAKPKLVRHSQRSYPVGGLSTMYWLGPAAGRRPSEHLLAGLGQARLELLLRAVECRAPPCSWSTSRASMPRACSRPSAAAASPRCARRRRCGGCSSRRSCRASRSACARSAAPASRSIPK